MISKSIFRSKCIIFFADSSIAGAWGKSVKSSTELREPLFCCVRRQTGGRLSNCPKWLKLKCVKQLRTLVIHFHLPNLLSPLHTSVTGSFKINGMEILKLVCFLRTQLMYQEHLHIAQTLRSTMNGELCALHQCSFMATQGDEETFPPPVTEVASVGTNKLQDKEFISRSYADHQFGHDALKLKCRRTMNQSNKTNLAREGSRNYPYF